MRLREINGMGMVCVVLGVLLGLVVTASAQGPWGPPMGGPGRGGPPPGAGGLPPFFMHVTLTDQQRAQIRTLVDDTRESRRAELEERRTLQTQLTTAIYGATTADADTVAQIVTRLGELQKQALEADVALQTKIAALLTEQQRHQIIELERSRPSPPARLKSGQ